MNRPFDKNFTCQLCMKTSSKSVLLSSLLLATTVAHSAEIPWSTFTGGGGIAQYGAVALGGAIGPIAPALSPATGGNYTLTGGFWPAFPGQPKAALPVLQIKSLGDGSQALLSWPVGVHGFILEYTPQLGSGQWFKVENAVVDTAVEHTVTVPAPSEFRCYRLRSQ
jgi:hypothetical protein